MAFPDPRIVGVRVGDGEAACVLVHGVREPVRVILGVRVEQGVPIVLVVQVPLVLADHVIV